MTYKPQILKTSEGGTGESSFGTSHGIVVYDGTNLVNYAGPQISTGGINTNTSQPLLYAEVSANPYSNVTGDGTQYTIVFDSIVNQQGSNYNNGTGVYTFPVTGNYIISCTVSYTGILVAHTTGTLLALGTDTVTERFGPYTIADSSGNATMSMNFIRNFSATNTLHIATTISNGTKVVGIQNSYFSAYTWLSIALLN